MGLTTTVGLWVVMQIAGVSGPERSIAYYQDKNDCTFIAASNPEWKCQERKDIEEAKKRRNDYLLNN
jgi:hypothetical protein